MHMRRYYNYTCFFGLDAYIHIYITLIYTYTLHVYAHIHYIYITYICTGCKNTMILLVCIMTTFSNEYNCIWAGIITTPGYWGLVHIYTYSLITSIYLTCAVDVVRQWILLVHILTVFLQMRNCKSNESTNDGNMLTECYISCYWTNSFIHIFVS